MEHQLAHFVAALIALLGTAKLLGALLQRFGQPAVLGELIAGVLLGPSVLGALLSWDWPYTPPLSETFQLLSEFGVLLLLFTIGLETNLEELLAVAGASTVVAVVGVVLPFALGFGVSRLLGQSFLVATVAGATLTATSVGITARVLAELGRLQDPESRIILGAAVLDDVLGLVILAVVSGLAQGQGIAWTATVRIAVVAFGFLAVALAVGWVGSPVIARLLSLVKRPRTMPLLALLFALALALAAEQAQTGLALVGAFAAGVMLAKTPQVKAIEQGLAPLDQFFVPIFFVMSGAAVDVRYLNPLDPANALVWQLGGLLLIAAVVGKWLAGYAPFWFRGNKNVIGVGMVPRGEVGLVFAAAGHHCQVLDDRLFGLLTVLVMVTTLVVPPLLKMLLGGTDRPSAPPTLVETLVTEG
jgi:Kef-type K+ transport system membrane component KefB